MMRPDLVEDERQPIPDARPSPRLTLVPFDAALHDAARVSRPRVLRWRTVKVVGRTAMAVLAGATCLLMLVGVVINLLGATP